MGRKEQRNRKHDRSRPSKRAARVRQDGVGDFRRLFAEINEWADKTFITTLTPGKAKHLREEAEELEEAIELGDLTKVAHELADIFLIAVHAYHCAGIDAYAAIREKFEIVKKRKWLPPDADGVIRHVK